MLRLHGSVYREDGIMVVRYIIKVEMKKGKKRVLFIILGVVGVIFILSIILLVNVLPVLSMQPIETGEVLDTGIYAVKNNSNNLFFIKAENGYIVIDAGSDASAVEESMKENEISPLDVKYVLLTHTDYDHITALSLFSNAEIFMSEDELQMIDGSTKRNIFSKNMLPESIDLSSITLLADREKIDLGGFTIESVKAPGHTLGSMAYIIDEQYLFTGDAFKVSDNIMKIHPFTMNKQIAFSTIQKLKKTKEGIKLVFTAHYGYFEADKIATK